MLQAYATQMALDKLGYENETIDISNFNGEIKKAKMLYFAKASLTSDFLLSKLGMAKNVLIKKISKNQYATLSKVRADKFDTFSHKQFRLSPKLWKELGLENKKVIGHIGRFCFQKNHNLLIDIFAEVIKREKDAVLILIGEGELENEVKNKVVCLGMEEKVLFLGRRADAYRYYQAMDLFMLPSRYEGLPVVGVEAQASGLPWVMSDVVTSEIKILDSTKFVSGGIDKYVNAVVEGLKVNRKDTSEEMIKAGFDIQTEARKLLEYYESLV